MIGAEPLRIVLLSYVVRGPLGGMTWHHLQYAMGFARLGHDVWVIEQGEDFASCYDAARQEMTTDPSYGLDYAGRVFDRAGLGQRWAYHDPHTETWRGPAAAGVASIIATADVVVNVSGVNPLAHGLEAVAHRVLIDTDPGFTQARHVADRDAQQLANAHTHHFTFAEAINDGATLPNDGLRWLPTRQPIVLDAWPVTPPDHSAAFTTVMQWDSYRTVEHEGRTLGMKSQSFEAFVHLPGAVPSATLELALGAAPSTMRRLEDAGWRLRDPVPISLDPWSYQRYLQHSLGELSVAKHGYVVTASGWFSERSACYLASGRPVVTQETGYSRYLPTGEGLFSFTTVEEAAAAIIAVSEDLPRHSAGARAIAEACFDARLVLSSLLERVSQQPARR